MPRKYCGETWWTWSGSNRRPLPCHASGKESGTCRGIAEEICEQKHCCCAWRIVPLRCLGALSDAILLRLVFRKSRNEAVIEPTYDSARLAAMGESLGA